MDQPSTHICLLSEQPSPNICPVLDTRFKPRKVVLLATPQQRARAPHVQAVLKPRGVAVEIVELPDPFDAFAVDNVVSGVIDRVAGEGLVLINATGGTKPMSIGAWMAGFNRDVRVFYVHHDAVSWLNPEGLPDEPLQDTLRLPDFLRMHGVELMSRESERIERRLQDLAEELVRHQGAYGESLRFLNWLGCKCRDVGRLEYTLDENVQLSERDHALIDKFMRADLLRATSTSLKFKDDAALRWCTGGWLEDHVARTVQRLKADSALHVQDAAHCVKIRFSDAAAGSRPRLQEDNELDVVVLANNQLYLIECKTRSMKSSQRFDPTDAFYKLATLKREVGGSQARAMFVSYFDISEVHRRRAGVLGVEVCAGREVAELPGELRRWLAPVR